MLLLPHVLFAYANHTRSSQTFESIIARNTTRQQHDWFDSRKPIPDVCWWNAVVTRSTIRNCPRHFHCSRFIAPDDSSNSLWKWWHIRAREKHATHVVCFVRRLCILMERCLMRCLASRSRVVLFSLTWPKAHARTWQQYRRLWSWFGSS